MATSTIVIESQRGIPKIDFKEVYRYRELFFTLVQRDIKVKYKQTIIGGLWAIIQPLTTMILFSFFFGKIAKIPSEGIPYPLFSYSGLLLWTYFSGAIGAASNSLTGNAGLISKVYFPRLIIPLSSTMVGLLDYVIAMVILLGMLVYFHVVPTLAVLLIPFIVVCTCLLAAGVGFWLSATNVLFRDVKFIVSFILQLWIYATPVIYPLSVAGKYTWLVSINPMSGLIETHRAAFLGQPINFGLLGVSLISTVIIFFSGLLYFKTIEKRFADVI